MILYWSETKKKDMKLSDIVESVNELVGSNIVMYDEDDKEIKLLIKEDED